MISPYFVNINKNFIGREHEKNRLSDIGLAGEAAIIITYGRRRVGKTELLEQAFRERNLLKFEGLEGQPQEYQISHVTEQLAEYVGEPLLAKLKFETWKEVFKAIADKTKDGVWTIYFEELQWLANYEDTFIAELKYVWDNYFQRNDNLIIILCGSSPSFMVRHVVESKSLYNRSQYEIPLMEFNLIETKAFLQKASDMDVLNAYLTVGGIPEYLKWLKKDASIFVSLCQHAFTSGAKFLKEFEKIFVSSLSENKHYKDIIELLAKYRYLSRVDLAKKIGISSGGTFSRLLDDLELCGFIKKYVPYHYSRDSKVARYCISDNYLQFYYKFVRPYENEIKQGDFNNDPVSALNVGVYHQWLGYSFERMCRQYHRVIAKMLGFSAVKYKYGPYFSRKTEEAIPGYQIDLLYDRADNVYTICEVRYSVKKISRTIIEEFERKIELFDPKREKTIQKVLITTIGADDSIINQPYFDKIITLKDFFMSTQSRNVTLW